jgi:outer membrane protein OmpA-like peptidoglycan-associated protein
VPQLPNLIHYLEKLIDSPNSQRHQANLQSLADYNKDYTALLLNCYVKTKKPEKISELIEKAGGRGGNETIFDVATAIEVCRQQEDTLEQAEKLAEKSQQWSLLVQIQIENRKQPAKALEIIDKRISSLREKVDCLQLYAPKLFKAIAAAKGLERQLSQSLFDLNKSSLVEQLQALARNIVGALLEHKKHKKFVSEQYRHLEMPDKRRAIRVEDLIQVFVDDIHQLKDFLQYVIETYGSNEATEKYLKEITSLNLYHRLLECYLYLNQNNQT